ncbi:ABC transporter permease [Ideonella livida]|uniref:ABC transporter permease n=1 Tax=Ideonella livida TaxID=2707176 RepID=A0A7C9PI22_9BURK|nr:ABC transporter permease [Ideonella livida]NDY91751.1 ABC transporter permease [Ideonella livida]
MNPRWHRSGGGPGAGATLLRLAVGSAWHRRFVLGLGVAAVALASLLLVGLEQLRHDLRRSFSQSLSGTDLVVGPRTGSVQLLLYAVFHLGQPAHALGWGSVQALAGHRAVDWVVPVALGDSFRGFPVVGTTRAYLDHLQVGDRQPLRLARGRWFVGEPGPQGESGPLAEVVLGAEVARRLGLGLEAQVVLAHGDGALAENDHTELPFRVVGVLAPTGTPVDRALHVSLSALQALHVDGLSGVGGLGALGAWAGLPGMGGPRAEGQPGGATPGARDWRQVDLRPRSVTAAFVGLKSRAAVFSVQRWVAQQGPEPAMAVLPGVVLDELWDVLGPMEEALLGASLLVGAVSLSGLVLALLAGLESRRRELALLRAVGAGPRHVLALLALEAALLTAAGVLAGALLAWVAMAALREPLLQTWGIVLQPGWPLPGQWRALGAVLAGGVLAGLLPGWRAYRLSLQDGLTPRD